MCSRSLVSLVLCVLAAALLLPAGAAAAATIGYGPTTPANGASLKLGQSVTVTLVASEPLDSPLYVNHLTDPTGTDRLPSSDPTASGTTYTYPAVRLDKAGTWTLRIMVSGTNGDFDETRTFTVRAAAAPHVLKSASSIYRFNGVDAFVATDTVRTCGARGTIWIRRIRTLGPGGGQPVWSTFRKDFKFVHPGGCKVYSYKWRLPDNVTGVGENVESWQVRDASGQMSNKITRRAYTAD